MQLAKVNKDRVFKNCWFAYFATLLFWGIAYNVDNFTQIIKGRFIGDFVLWYSAAMLAKRAGSGPLNVYDLDLQYRNLIELVRPLRCDQGTPVQYPPHFYALVRPLANLSLHWAYAAWCLLALPLIIIALFQLSKNFGKAHFSRAFFILAGLMSFPTCYAFSIGQTTIYQYPTLAAFWLLTRSNKFFSAGIVSALLTVKLQYAPFVILIGLILGRARFLLGLLTGGTVLAVFTVASIGLQNLIVYPKALLTMETNEQGIAAPVMQNFRGELMLFYVDVHLVHKIATGIFVVGIICVAFLWGIAYPKISKKAGEAAFALCLLLTTCIMLIFSPHTHFQDYMSVSIPVAFTYPLLKDIAPKDTKRRMLRLLLWGFPLFSWIPIFLIIPLVLLKIEPYFVWAILVIGISISLCVDYIKGNVDKQTLENTE
jgi:hypothetical protein